jgi:AcrR family transcriptional regulator
MRPCTVVRSGQAVPGADPADPAPATEGRVARNRRRRAEAFLAAGLRIATEEGLEALTMARLADALDTAVGSVYRYYSSKDELIAAIQANAVEQLHRSHDRSVEPVAAEVAERLAGSADSPDAADQPDTAGPAGPGASAALVRLVVLGRWFCAAAEHYPEEVRLLQLVSSRRTPTHTREGAAALLPSTLSFVAAVGGTIEAATAAGDLRPGPALGRAVMWLTAFGGVFVADDLGQYLPSVLGGGRLVRQLNADLLVGWGAPLDAVQHIERAIDSLPETAPLVR